jgi:hypothetical protein
MPLSEDHNRGLNLDDDRCLLERRGVLLPPETIQHPHVSVGEALPVVRTEVSFSRRHVLVDHVALLAPLVRIPRDEATVRAHASGFDDRLVRAHEVDELHVPVIEDLERLTFFHW